MMNNDRADSETSNRPRTILIKVPQNNKDNLQNPSSLEKPVLANENKNSDSMTMKLRRLMDKSEYKAFLHNLYDGVMITDINGQIIYVNHKACKLCKCSFEYLCSKKIIEIITGITEATLLSVLEALKNGHHVLVETECLRHNGTIFSCEVAVTYVRFFNMEQLCFFVRDITEREEAKRRLVKQEQELSMGEEQLRESLLMLKKREHELSQERDVLQSLIDTIPDRIFFRDENGCFLRINMAMTKFLGLSDPVDVQGKTDFDFFDEKDARVFFEDDRRVMLEGKPIFDKLQKITAEDGSAQYSTVSKVPMRSRDGKLLGLVGISRDVTDRIQAEQQLEAAQQKIVRMKRLEATALFAGQIAHDFNNLLVPLLIYPDMIKKHLEKNSQAYNDLDIIKNSAQQIANLNEDLVALSHRGKAKEEILDLHEAVSDVINSIARSVTEKRMDLEWLPEAKHSHIKFDPTQLSRVLHNMFQNAIDAIDDKGQLILSTENVSMTEPFGKYVQVIPGEYVKLSISDNGSGIPDEIKDKIFDPFFTTKSSGKSRGGSGLGLSVVYGILNDYKSSIDLDSEVGQGTTFTLYFPICMTEAKREKKNDHQNSGVGKTIMIVENDQLHSEVVQRILTDLGYTVNVVDNGEKALKTIEDTVGHFPDLVLLDIDLGDGMDGVQTFQKIRSINPTQKAITVSGLSDSNRIEEGLQRGILRHLRKPLLKESLAQAITEELTKSS